MMDEQVGKLIEPAAVPFTYTTPGWYVLGGLILLLIILLIWLLIKQYRLNRYRRDAGLLLTAIENKYQAVNAFDVMVYEADMLIKRIAMSRYGRQKVSGLRSGEWTTFINGTWREKSFNTQDEKLLTQSIYQSADTVSADDATQFVQKAKRWIKHHKRKQ